MRTSEVLVIGGGFAGLSAAIHLAAAGADVHLVEQDETLGGKAGQVRADGFRFDTGPSVFTLPEVYASVFAAAGRSVPIELTPLDLTCRYRFPSGRVWDVYRDVDRTVAQLSQDEADVYVRLLAEARRMFEAAAPTFVYGAAPSTWDLVRWGMRHGLTSHPHRSLEGLLDAFGATGDLKTFFLRFATYFGADPYRAPAILHNIAWVELGLGASYPRGGIHAAVDALADLARDLGVRISTGVQVQSIHSAGRRVRTVDTDRGPLEADRVVAATDRVTTLSLLGREPPQRGSTSLSGFVLLLGVEGPESNLAHHTIAFPEDYRQEFAAIRRGALPSDPTLYMHLSCRREPSDAPEGAENWFVMANAPSLPQGASLSEARARESEYAGEMERMLERSGLLDGRTVRVRRWRGPSDLARYGHRGAIYGRAPHSLLATLRPGQRVRGVENLVLAGGTVHPGGGIPLALLSGRAAAEQVLSRR